MPNGQPPKPKDWPEWVVFFKEAVKDVEIQLELLRAQLKEAQAHARGK